MFWESQWRDLTNSLPQGASNPSKTWVWTSTCNYTYTRKTGGGEVASENNKKKLRKKIVKIGRYSPSFHARFLQVLLDGIPCHPAKNRSLYCTSCCIHMQMGRPRIREHEIGSRLRLLMSPWGRARAVMCSSSVQFSFFSFSFSSWGYWNRDCCATDLRAILHSQSRITYLRINYTFSRLTLSLHRTCGSCVKSTASFSLERRTQA